MDLLHTQFIQSRNLIDKVSTIKNINYTGLIADEDPTRLNRNIGSNSESIITTTLFVYNNSKEAHSYSDGASGKIKAANITAGECGQLTYKDILYLVLYLL
jgi:hypothetical protein